MTSLSTRLLEPATRPQVVDALVQLADTEMAAKTGLSGAVLRTAYGAAKRLGEGRVRRAVDAVLPGVASTLDPYHDAAGATPFGAYLADPARSSQVADQLLAVADAKAAAVEGNPLGRVYSSVRGRAKDHVVAALPGLGTTLERFAR
ncbi:MULTISPECIES: DUF6918 family protein [unclassified Ornithinimicrobium]|uniref:DUF6918 family protein n=1 Tax=unclassified Ornithinimicrobium TaxID=2615080 RepID=UPI003851E8C9